MESVPVEPTAEVAKRFFARPAAFFAKTRTVGQDEIAARQLHAQHLRPRDRKLRLANVTELFLMMRES
jgi:hypothetical protein